MPCFNDVINVSSPIFFIYIGFNIAAFAFLTQYLTFPRSMLSDLSNMKKNTTASPRIMDSEVVKVVDDTYWPIISYFFQLDYVTFSLLMFILYSILLIIILTAIHFGIKLLSAAAIFLVSFITIIYFLLRAYLIKEYVLKKETIRIKEKEVKRYIRGDPYWTKTERERLVKIEICISSFLLIGIIIACAINSGMALFLFLVFILVCKLAWHLWVTASINPVTRLIKLWEELTKL